jgi:hypothetical protein
VSDHDGRVLLYDVDDRVELDRVGQVVDEVDEKAEAREEQQDCAGDREPRKLLDATNTLSTTATTEIIVPAVPMSSVRASSGVPWKTSLYSNPSRGTGTNESTEPATSAASAAIPGSTHSDPRTYSPTSSRRLLLPASPNIRSREWPVERIVQSRLIVSSPLCGGSLRGRWSHHMRNEVL